MFDTQHVVKDDGEVTSTGYGEVDASAQVLDLGSGLIRGNLILDVTRLAMQGNDQTYQIHLMGGDDESFTNTVSLAVLEVGPKETTQDNKDSKLGRYIIPFENQRNGTVYPYVRVRHVLGGTGPVIDYVSRLEKATYNGNGQCGVYHDHYLTRYNAHSSALYKGDRTETIPAV